MCELTKRVLELLLEDKYSEDFERPDSLSVATALKLLPTYLPIDCCISTDGYGDLRFSWSLNEKWVQLVVDKGFKYLHLYAPNVPSSIEYDVTTEKITEALIWLRMNDYKLTKEQLNVINRSEFERMVRSILQVDDYSVAMVERVEDDNIFCIVEKVQCNDISEFQFVNYYDSPGIGILLNHFCYNGLIEAGKYLISL